MAAAATPTQQQKWPKSIVSMYIWLTDAFPSFLLCIFYFLSKNQRQAYSTINNNNDVEKSSLQYGSSM